MLGYRKVPASFLKEAKRARRLCEDYSDEDMPEFAVLSPDGTQICNWMKCKDFVQDTIWGAKNGIDYSIYGWNFNSKNVIISKRYILLAMRWIAKSSNGLKACLENVKGTIENLEKRLGIPAYQRTRFSRVIKGGSAQYHFVVYGSPMWLRCVGTVSFFTWLLRASLTNEGRTLEEIPNSKCAVDKDAYYFKSGKDFIAQLLAKGFESFTPDWENKDVNKVHHNGFVKYAARIKQKMPTFNESDATGSIVRGYDYDDYNDDEEWDFV